MFGFLKRRRNHKKLAKELDSLHQSYSFLIKKNNSLSGGQKRAILGTLAASHFIANHLIAAAHSRLNLGHYLDENADISEAFRFACSVHLCNLYERTHYKGDFNWLFGALGNIFDVQKEYFADFVSAHNNLINKGAHKEDLRLKYGMKFYQKLFKKTANKKHFESNIKKILDLQEITSHMNSKEEKVYGQIVTLS